MLVSPFRGLTSSKDSYSHRLSFSTDLGSLHLTFSSFKHLVDHSLPVVVMPVDSPETLQAGALEDIVNDRRRSSVTGGKGLQQTTAMANDIAPGERYPTADELHGPSALRRVAAPIPWSVYTVAFVELCERFSYYGTQIVYSNFVSRPLPPAVGGPPGSNHNTGAGGGSDQVSLDTSTSIDFTLTNTGCFWSPGPGYQDWCRHQHLQHLLGLLRSSVLRLHC